MELTKERLIVIVSVAIAIIAIGLYLFLYGPLVGKLRVASAEYKTIEADLLLARDSIAALKTAETEKGLIAEEDTHFAIDELTRQGKLKGANFISITPMEIERSDYQYRVLPIKMELESTYEQLAVLLGSLDDMEKSLITVRDFNITTDSENPEKLITKLMVDMYLLE